MLLKRYLVLAAGVLLFIFVFIAVFAIARSQMEGRFREEREKYGVDKMVLTAPDTPSATAPLVVPPSTNSVSAAETAPTPSPAPAATTDSSAISVAPPAASSPIDTSVPSPTAPPDASPIIGPVPPQSSQTPETSPAPAEPALPDTNSAPMTPSSTMLFPGNSAAFLVFAAYEPSQSSKAQPPGFEPPRSSTPTPTPPPIPTPATNAAASHPATTNAPASSAPATATNSIVSTPTTNSAPALTNSAGTARPPAVEASVIVLLYHQFYPPSQPSRNPWSMNVDVFEQEMKYLKDNGYHVVPLADVVRFTKHEIGLPPGSVAITIDDGYKSAIVYAAPILKKYGFPWTYFIYPDFITVNEGKGAASWNDLLALQADGVDIESHSMTHPKLTSHHQKVKGVWHNFSPEEYDQWLTNETAGAKALLEQKMGKPITCFAYPYGDYNKQVEAKVIAAGYDAIFTVADNPVHTTTDKDSIGRYTITQEVEKNFAAYLRQGALGLAEADPAPGSTITNPRPVITAVLGYAGTIDPNSIETSVRDFGEVRHDFDPKTSMVRLYLPRDLVQPVNLVNIRVKDAQSGQVMVANWHFNFEPGATATHPPIGAATNAAPALTNAPSSSIKEAATAHAAPQTNSPAANAIDPAVKDAMGTPLEPPKVSPH